MICNRPAPGVVYSEGGKVYLERSCETHGVGTSCISSDERLYFRSTGSGGCGSGCGCGPRTTEENIEKIATCIALIEIVTSCNLACPVCFSDAPKSGTPDAISFEEFTRRVNGVIDRKGGLEILQLSGGEPTLHPEFFRLVSWAQSNPSIDYVLINTNGVRIAQDDEFVAGLAKIAPLGKLQFYLQFDGPGIAGQRELRGADLRRVRADAVSRLGDISPKGIPITLAMTVVEQNIDQVWEAAQFGLQFPHVRGVAYQPLFGSGRVAPALNKSNLNAADIVGALETYSKGVFGLKDFTPLPCGDPNCALIGYLLKLPEGPTSIARFVEFSDIQGFLEDRLTYDLEDLARCGCESEPLGDLLKQFELRQEHTFRMFIKPFMDSGSWDNDRIDRCCTHVIRPDGKLDSFCRYYADQAGSC